VRRREFISLVTGVVVGWPKATHAQQPASKVYRIGYLAHAKLPHLIKALQEGLLKLGYVEGQNVKIEYRFAEGHPEMLDAMAAELVRLNPDAIVTVGTAPAIAAKRATPTIPIVMATAGDPLQSGVVVSLARPGGNVTGVTLYGFELTRKRLEVFKEVAPDIVRVAVLSNASNPYNASLWQEAQRELSAWLPCCLT
jgi:putative ABC transport system substrate-binding protein